jgi:hypothetical protein
MLTSGRLYMRNYLHKDVISMNLNLENINQPNKKNGTIAISANSKSKRGLQFRKFSQSELSLSARLAKFHYVNQD